MGVHVHSNLAIALKSSSLWLWFQYGFVCNRIVKYSFNRIEPERKRQVLARPCKGTRFERLPREGSGEGGGGDQQVKDGNFNEDVRGDPTSGGEVTI